MPVVVPVDKHQQVHAGALAHGGHLDLETVGARPRVPHLGPDAEVADLDDRVAPEVPGPGDDLLGPLSYATGVADEADAGR